LAEALVAGCGRPIPGAVAAGRAAGGLRLYRRLLFRWSASVAFALHGAARRWLINEKGAVAAAAALPARRSVSGSGSTRSSRRGGDPVRLAARSTRRLTRLDTGRRLRQ